MTCQLHKYMSWRTCRNKRFFFSLQNRENSSSVRVKPGILVPVNFLLVPNPTRKYGLGTGEPILAGTVDPKTPPVGQD